FAALPSRSTCPGAHMAMPHDPPVHLAVALGRLQTTPQPPQFMGSVPKPALAYSQPSPGIPSQSLNPGAQLATWHVPIKQAPTPFMGWHLTLQPPQLLGSVVKPPFAYSQPSAGRPSQLLKPALHMAITHCPPTQLDEALARAHLMLQPPQ